jgi:hypothetical protein
MSTVEPSDILKAFANPDDVRLNWHAVHTRASSTIRIFKAVKLRTPSGTALRSGFPRRFKICTFWNPRNAPSGIVLKALKDKSRVLLL